MKIRIFKNIVDGVFNVRVQTEDWSQNDKDLMVKFGEPEINLGGKLTIDGESSDSSPYLEVTLDDVYARVMTESPFIQTFDSRDYGTIDIAKQLASQWALTIESRIALVVTALRAKDNFFATEEITEY